MIETKLNQLVINKLSKEQYRAAKESGQLSENELYITPVENELPDPTDLSDGTAIVAVDGKFEPQDGYGYTQYFDELKFENLNGGYGDETILGSVKLPDSFENISCHLNFSVVSGSAQNIDSDITFTRIGSKFEYKYGTTIGEGSVVILSINNDKLSISVSGMFMPGVTYNLHIYNYNFTVYEIHRFDLKYMPVPPYSGTMGSSLNGTSTVYVDGNWSYQYGYGYYGKSLEYSNKLNATIDAISGSYTATTTDIYIEYEADEYTIYLSYDELMPTPATLTKQSMGLMTIYSGTWNESNITLTGTTLTITNLQQPVVYFFRQTEGFGLMTYHPFDSRLIPREVPKATSNDVGKILSVDEYGNYILVDPSTINN